MCLSVCLSPQSTVTRECFFFTFVQVELERKRRCVEDFVLFREKKASEDQN